jgi:metal-sulfur cluster biosynthetic enzyme
MNEDPAADAELRERVRAVLRDVVDPEVGLDVVALGLVYGIEAREGDVRVELTLTTPACPLGEQIAADAERRITALPGVARAQVELVWDPPWTPERMSDAARRALGWGG